MQGQFYYASNFASPPPLPSPSKVANLGFWSKKMRHGVIFLSIFFPYIFFPPLGQRQRMCTFPGIFLSKIEKNKSVDIFFANFLSGRGAPVLINDMQTPLPSHSLEWKMRNVLELLKKNDFAIFIFWEWLLKILRKLW